MSLALYTLAYLAVAFVVAVGLTRKGLHPDDATSWVFVPVLAAGCVVLVIGMMFRDAVDWCARRLPPRRQGEPR